MKLLFKQRFFSWFDSYDIYDEAGNTVYTVEGKLAWGHCLHILDADGNHIGTVQQKMLTFLLPLYAEEGKSALVIAIGCTGGHHRSVAVAHELAEYITEEGYQVTENHRDISR